MLDDPVADYTWNIPESGTPKILSPGSNMNPVAHGATKTNSFNLAIASVNGTHVATGGIESNHSTNTTPSKPNGASITSLFVSAVVVLITVALFI